MINQPTGRKGGFLFIDGPIIRPRPRPRPRPGLWRRRNLQQILNGSPSSLPWHLMCKKAISYLQNSHILQNQSYFESALRLRLKINTMLKFQLFLFDVFIAILRDFKQCKGGIDTFYFKTKNRFRLFNFTLKCIMNFSYSFSVIGCQNINSWIFNTFQGLILSL